MALESVRAYSGFTGGQSGKVYNEAAFRYFLDVDRRRAERWMRSLLLVLVAIRETPGSCAMLTDAMSTSLFSGLGACLREVDYVGWYRESRVAAAVLAQGVKLSGDVPQRVAERVHAALRQRFSADQSRNLRIRVVRLGRRVGV